MNLMRILSAILILPVLFVLSCKSKFEISGQWMLEKEEVYINGNLVNTIEDTGITIEFFEDGTGYDSKGPFKWEVNNNKLKIIDYDEVFEYTIKAKGATRLVIEDRGFSDQKKGNDIIVLTLTR